MHISELTGKKILIAGYGMEGIATETYLRAKVPTAVIGIADKNSGSEYLNDQSEYNIAIKTPGILKNLIQIPYTTATNIFFAQVKGKVIGVTGSKGKSTTSSLIYHILNTAGKQVHLAGNIGNPLLSELLISNTSEDIWVCELSSYQTEDLTYSPHISIITSLFPEHMTYHGSVEAYYDAKKNMLQYMQPDDYYIYNPRFPRLQQWAAEVKGKAVPYGGSLPLESGDSPLLGLHNHDNMRAAATLAHLMGIDDATIIQAIRSFKPLPHRLEKVGTWKGITFYDDAISTAPESTIAALEALPQVSVILLGGEDRGYDFSTLAHALHKHLVPTLIVFPESGTKIEAEVRHIHGYTPQIVSVRSMQEAVNRAYAAASPNTICLLSTASPSYSLWKNFEEKGTEFQKWARELGTA